MKLVLQDVGKPAQRYNQPKEQLRETRHRSHCWDEYDNEAADRNSEQGTSSGSSGHRDNLAKRAKKEKVGGQNEHEGKQEREQEDDDVADSQAL